MNSIKVYGASDDLVEIEGGVNEEFSVYDAKFTLIFSGGEKIKGEYAEDGCWHFNPVNFTPKSHFVATDSDSDQYSDVIEFESKSKSVKIKRHK